MQINIQRAQGCPAGPPFEVHCRDCTTIRMLTVDTTASNRIPMERNSLMINDSYEAKLKLRNQRRIQVTAVNMVSVAAWWPPRLDSHAAAVPSNLFVNLCLFERSNCISPPEPASRNISKRWQPVRVQWNKFSTRPQGEIEKARAARGEAAVKAGLQTLPCGILRCTSFA